LSNGFSVEYSISTNAETARFDEIIEDIGDGRAEMILFSGFNFIRLSSHTESRV
jgi:hypothetical protein